MLSKRLLVTYKTIILEAMKMVETNVDKEDLTTDVDYASIYAQSTDEFNRITKELKGNGTVALEKLSGDYYKLQEPIQVLNIIIHHCRVRIFDNQHPELGYVDFKVKDFNHFKNKYLNKPNFSLVDDGEKIIRLKDPDFNVHAYFPNSNF